MLKPQRSVLTGRNASWVVGYRKEQLPDGTWQRALNSEWVYAIRNNSREPIPPHSKQEVHVRKDSFPCEYPQLWDLAAEIAGWGSTPLK